MKKNSSIVIGLFLLFALVISCEQDEEINDLNSIGDKMIINQKSQTLLDPTNVNKEEIEEVSCGDPAVYTIKAGQHIEVGELEISNSAKQLFVTYNLNSDWTLKETHLYVGPKEEIPYTNAGNPKIGHFTYHGDPNDLYKPFVIDLDQLDECFVIIAHAVVQSNGGTTETAFAEEKGNTFDGNRWGWYIDYCEQECDVIDTDDSGEENGDSGSGEDENDGEEDGDDGNDGNDNGGNGEDGTNGGTGSGNDLTDGGQGTTGGSGGTDVVCKESYARGTLNSCFLDDGFNNWGWTNNIPGGYSLDYAGGVNYTFDLIANAYDCDVLAGEVIGQVEVTVRGGDGRFRADLNVYTNDNYELNDIHVYIGSGAYPTDSSGSETIDLSAFTKSESGLSGNLWMAEDLQWPFNANLIVRVNACTAGN